MDHIQFYFFLKGNGLIQESDVEAWKVELKQDVVLAPSRRLLAVPFIGKDVPSRVSEFSSPDVCIGLTFLAYKYEGLRARDMSDILFAMKRKYSSEAGPVQSRRSWLEFAQFLDKEQIEDNGHCGVLPLDLIQPSDLSQLNSALRVLRKSSPVVYRYCQTCFAATMKFHKRKLQASGIDVGGTILFKYVLGFSGTPSTLLPDSLGECMFEDGCEARVVKILTSPKHVRPIYPSKACKKWKSLFVDDEDWSVESVLRGIAAADPPYHALIDAGAIITGFRNEEVARYLLLNGLKHCNACVFLDDSGAKMAVVRSGAELSPVSVPLEQCGVHISARFCFFDQIHTTGTDMKMPMDARAVATIGKGMTLRDHAQACWRMRGLELGQTVEILLVNEIFRLIQPRDPEQKITALSNFENEELEVLNNVLVWLIKNGLHSEKLQQIQFTSRKIMNCWRTKALDQLLSSSAPQENCGIDPDSSVHVTRFKSRDGSSCLFDLEKAKSNISRMYNEVQAQNTKPKYSSKTLNKTLVKQKIVSLLHELPATVKIGRYVDWKHFFSYAVQEIKYVLNWSKPKTVEEALSNYAKEISWLISESQSSVFEELTVNHLRSSKESSVSAIPGSRMALESQQTLIPTNKNLSKCLNVFIESLDHTVPTSFDQKESILLSLTKSNKSLKSLLGSEAYLQSTKMLQKLKRFTTKTQSGEDSSQGLDRYL
jgi:hypothetical protein